jgi:hypothetical protein
LTPFSTNADKADLCGVPLIQTSGDSIRILDSNGIVAIESFPTEVSEENKDKEAANVEARALMTAILLYFRVQRNSGGAVRFLYSKPCRPAVPVMAIK